MGGGNGHFQGYNPICIAGPQMNKKIMRKLNTMALTDEQKAYLHHDGALDPHARIKEMDLMGIDQVLVIPTMVIMHLPFARDPEGVEAFCQAYNDFLVDWCGEERGRLFGAALLPIQDPERAAREIHRASPAGSPGRAHPAHRRQRALPQRRRPVHGGRRRSVRPGVPGLRGHRHGARDAHLPGAVVPASPRAPSTWRRRGSCSPGP